MSAAWQSNRVSGNEVPRGPLYLAIGMFDGVHRGHQAVILPAVAAARREGGTAAVLTFWPHPSTVLRPHDEPIRLLMQPDEKQRLLREFGVACVITQPFTAEFAAWPAEVFLARRLQQWPDLVAVYVGENWRYGRGRAGDAARLQDEGASLGVRVISVPRVLAQGAPISSTRIRALLEAGEMESVNALLGYVYRARGRVKPGQGLGRKLGFPTLNLDWQTEARPKLGVYAVTVAREGAADSVPAVANYGVRPTVDGMGAPVLEVHVLGACPFSAGQEMEVQLHHFLRAEQKFADVAALQIQIAADKQNALSWFANR